MNCDLSILNSDSFTLINQIPKSETVATKTAWRKNILTMCGKKDGIYDRSSGGMIYKANTWTAFIFDWQNYKKPLWTAGGYYALTQSEQAQWFTVSVGDLLIFADIPDTAPESLQEFNTLRDKYKDSGGIITGAEVYIRFKPDGTPWRTNHIEVIKS